MRLGGLTRIADWLSGRAAARRGERAILSRLPRGIYSVTQVVYVGMDGYGEESFPAYEVKLEPAGLEPRTMLIGVQMNYGEPVFMRRSPDGRWDTLPV